jgi:OTU domain-containing protein 6
VELRALTQFLQQPIEVIQAEGPSVLIGDEFAKHKLVITYHRHYYGLGEHYNSTKAAES